MAVIALVVPVIAAISWLVGYYVGFAMGAADAQVQELDRTLTRLEKRVRSEASVAPRGKDAIGG